MARVRVRVRGGAREKVRVKVGVRVRIRVRVRARVFLVEHGQGSALEAVGDLLCARGERGGRRVVGRRGDHALGQQHARRERARARERGSVGAEERERLLG